MTFDVLQHSQKLSRLVQSQCPFVVITLIAIRGSAPQVIGAKAIVTTEGIESGTIGGGKIEAAAIKHAQSLLGHDSTEGAELVTWNLQTDVGMTCGGEVKLFFEIHGWIDWPIAVFGAGHVAQSLIPLLSTLHCRITCIDPRSDWLNKLADHPRLEKRQSDNPVELVAQQPGHSFFVLISKGHTADLPVLEEILKTRNAPYVGVIGSNQKAKVLNRELAAKGVPQKMIDSFNCPIGLPMGNNTPSEIAISIAAQLLQHRDRIPANATQNQ